MLRKSLAMFGIMATLSHCSPVYAMTPEMTEANCIKAKTLARQIVIDLQQHSTQYDIMKGLNDRPMSDFGENGEIVKLYLQVNTSALANNVRKRYRLKEILSAVERDCKKYVVKAS